ncbi:MAG: hypothetical protein K2H38_08060 [Muribaculaceae bacterium]|nr:hypothetical protein [Muribaculaceae bacterium]
MTNPTATDICDVPNLEDLEIWTENEDAPDFLQEVKDAAWNIVRENPGIDRSAWIDTLIRHFPAEVVDAFGVNPPEVYHELSDLWETEYTDPETGEWNSFADWSEYFATNPDAL